MKLKAFTLAEILIVLVLIGVLTAILLPVAFHAAPDENVMKFKKGYNALATVIRELVTSEKYYKDGDLGVRFDGTQVLNKITTREYFCKTFADVVNPKEVNCLQTDMVAAGSSGSVILNGKKFGQSYTPQNPTEEQISAAKDKLDSSCKSGQSKMPKEIVLNDGTIFYSTSAVAFGSQDTTNEDGTRYVLRFFSPPGQFPANYSDEGGFDIAYKIFCMDIDDFNKGEDPFGFGIRADGKILTGTRADEWINKSIQKGDE